MEEKPLEKKRLTAALKLFLMTAPPEAPIIEEDDDEEEDIEEIPEIEGDIRTV